MADIPDPEYNIRTTPKLLMTTASGSAISPLQTGLSPKVTFSSIF